MHEGDRVRMNAGNIWFCQTIDVQHAFDECDGFPGPFKHFLQDLPKDGTFAAHVNAHDSTIGDDIKISTTHLCASNFQCIYSHFYTPKRTCTHTAWIQAELYKNIHSL